MIRCPKCCIDYDLCDCGTEETPQKTIGDYITRFFIGVVILACVIGMFSCNPTKQMARKAAKLERKAEKKLYQSISLDPMPFTIECAQKFNPIDSIHERYDTIILPPETKYVTIDIDSLINEYLAAFPPNINCDSLLSETKKRLSLGKGNKVNLPCPPCDSTKIINSYRFQAESNKAELERVTDEYKGLTAQLRDERDEARVSEGKVKERRNMWRIAAIVLACYTLLRWLVRYFTKGRINIP